MRDKSDDTWQKRLFKRILFALTPAALLLILAEGGLRIVDFRFSAKYLDTPIFEPDDSPGMVHTAAMLIDEEPGADLFD